MPKNKSLRQLLGENIAEIMAAKNLNQSQVAAAAKKRGFDVDQTTVSRVIRAGKEDATEEEAKYPTTVDKIEAIAAGCGVQPWELVIPAGRDKRFLGMLNAWSRTNEQGRKLLALAARGALEQEAGEAAGGGASVTELRRARGD